MVLVGPGRRPHRGRITGRVRNHNKDIFVEGYLTQGTQLTSEKTFYTRYGDVFVYGVLIVTFIMIVSSLLFRNKQKHHLSLY